MKEGQIRFVQNMYILLGGVEKELKEQYFFVFVKY